MGLKFTSKIKRILSSTASTDSTPKTDDDVDVREEYANAFRTESYNQFWTRVTHLTHKKSTVIESSSTSARLMSYRLFAHNLLDPDPNTITRILNLTRIQQPTRTLLSDYFTQTANAFFLCTLLLKKIQRLRSNYESIKPQFQINSLDFINQFTDPVISSGSRIQIIRSDCLTLLNRIESNRDKTRTKLKLINGLTHSSAILVLALTTTLVITIASHAFALVISGPVILTGWFKPVSLRNKLIKTAARLDVAAKGTYILSRDLDTISRLVTRVNDEVEHVGAMARFWRGRVRAEEEVAREIKRSEEKFSEEIDELEEHIYLCLMMINRMRNLVITEIFNSNNISNCSLAHKSK